MTMIQSASYPGTRFNVQSGAFEVDPNYTGAAAAQTKMRSPTTAELEAGGLIFDPGLGSFRLDPDWKSRPATRTVEVGSPTPARSGLDLRKVEFDPLMSGGVWRPKVPTAETRAEAIECEVPRSEIQPALVADVERTIRMASRTLGIEAPRVRWLPRGTKGIRGIVFDANLHEIWVVEQAPADARNSGLHELRHCYQLTSDRWLALGLTTMEQRQEDAQRFADTWAPTQEMKAATGQALVHKTVPQRLRAVKAAGTGSWEIEGYASVWANVPDSYNDVVAKGAFARSIQTRSTKFLFEHQTPIGNQLELKEDETGLYGRWSVVDTMAGTDARKLAMAGVCGGLSIGYVPLDAETRSDGVRILKDCDLYEVSLVSLPAQPLAVVTGVKSGLG